MYILRYPYRWSKPRLIDYGTVLYIPVYFFYFGKKEIIDAFGKRLVPKAYGFAFVIKWFQLKLDIRYKLWRKIKHIF